MVPVVEYINDLFSIDITVTSLKKHAKFSKDKLEFFNVSSYDEFKSIFKSIEDKRVSARKGLINRLYTDTIFSNQINTNYMQVKNDLSVLGNTAMEGNLGVRGATSLNGSLGVNGPTSLNSSLGVSGA